MAVRRIMMLGEPVLRQKSKKIHRFDGSTKQLIEDLIETVRDVGGSGLAAPQIGVPLRAFVSNIEDRLQVVINPEIIDRSEDEIEDNEGCLSIPGWWGPVKRHARVTVRGLSRTGKPIKIKAEALEARCFQHEVDHLDGILYIDRVEDRSKLFKAESKEEEEELEQEEVFA